MANLKIKTKMRELKMINNLKILNEPFIECGYSQKVVDPRIGLSLFGPYDIAHNTHPTNISIGIIGTEEGIELFLAWSEKVMLEPCMKVEKNRNIWPPFPGFQTAFQSIWPRKLSRIYKIDGEFLIEQSKNKDPFARTAKIVDAYLNEIKKFKVCDEQYDVILCIVPEEVFLNCRKKSQIRDGWGSPLKKNIRNLFIGGQTQLFEDEDVDPKAYRFSIDFRRQIKARCMRYDIPIQIIRESTLRLSPDSYGERGLTPISDRAWNLGTAIFYKSGGKPWRLSTARDGVSYVGISFKRTEAGEKAKTACCVAQMFLDSGDGVVFLGEKGPWYSPDDGQYHLTKESARNLLAGTLDTYELLEGKGLKEIFLHSYSEISAAEFEGYREACPERVKLVGVRIRNDDVRLFRNGRYPVPRGTFWKWNDRAGYLWANGFKWPIRTYDGSQVPRPLKIDIMHGNADIDQVASDIFGLTKLNYNACRIGDSGPVTIKYASEVGEILINNPTVTSMSHKFKFYI